jgi:hypothetical protein
MNKVELLPEIDHIEDNVIEEKAQNAVAHVVDESCAKWVLCYRIVWIVLKYFFSFVGDDPEHIGLEYISPQLK